MKIIKKISLFIIDNLLTSFTGWLIGLASVQLVNSFLEEKGWSNLWGYWSDKKVVSHDEYVVISWLITAIIGWLVMYLWNKFVVELLLDPIITKLKD